MNDLLKFLKSQRILVVASHDGDDIWVANLYFGVDDDFRMYFVSPEDAKHSRQMLGNPKVAFSVSWFNPEDHRDRKGVQGLGTCRPADSEDEIAKGVELHNRNFPAFSERITVDWIRSNEWGSRVWVVEPSYVKFWNDEMYKEEESKEFKF